MFDLNVYWSYNKENFIDGGFMGKYLRKQRLVALSLAGLLSLSACGPTELSSDKSDMDILKTTDDDFDDLGRGVVQEKDVLGEDFKLILKYYCDEEIDWRVTDTKRMNMEIKTSGLSKDLEVYIDNIHIDTSIVSGKILYSGILQDTMDDRIHNSLMLGFPISDTVSYYGCNIIEGQNSEFVEGFSYGYNGYSGGSIATRRRKESDYLSAGVWANQIDSVIDLIIVDKNTQEKRIVSVFSNLLVEVNHRITFLEDGNYVTYEYDRNGNKTKIDECSNELTLKK